MENNRNQSCQKVENIITGANEVQVREKTKEGRRNKHLVIYGAKGHSTAGNDERKEKTRPKTFE